jgi:cytochrome oxidase Cu insertion factor (SCO1/SenC/PrrC family)
VRGLVWALAVLAGVGVGVLILVLQGHPAAAPTAPVTTLPPGAAATWAPGALRAPDFALRDENGNPVSLARFRGRRVLLTFMDPLCTDFCPLEAKIVDAAEARLPAARRPVVIAVSVNPWGNTRATLLGDVRKWKLTGAWHWAIGERRALAAVWRHYDIGVQPTTGHDVAHTEALYLIDARGDQRALWLWPFRSADLAAALRTMP